MPLVRIDLSKTQPKELAQKVGDIIFQAMRNEINVPADDKFQIITHHDSDELVRPKSYMGIEYSEGIIFYSNHFKPGKISRSQEKILSTHC
jgi:hypothetical protein